MGVNPKRWEIVHISRSSKPFQLLYSIHGEILKEAHKANYLGIILSDTLYWSPLISKIVNKASSKIAFPCDNLHQCPQTLKEQAYLALIHSVLEYTAPVRDPHLNKDVNVLVVVQCHAASSPTTMNVPAVSLPCWKAPVGKASRTGDGTSGLSWGMRKCMPRLLSPLTICSLRLTQEPEYNHKYTPVQK